MAIHLNFWRVHEKRRQAKLEAQANNPKPQTEWSRPCPLCSAPITYNAKGAYYQALRKNTKCRDCGQKNKKPYNKSGGRHSKYSHCGVRDTGLGFIPVVYPGLGTV